MSPADQGLVLRSATRSLVRGSVAARGSDLLGGLLCEDRLDGVALGLGLALDVRPNRLGTLEHLRIGLAAFDPVLQRETDFFGDAAIVELGDDVQLRPQVDGVVLPGYQYDFAVIFQVRAVGLLQE